MEDSLMNHLLHRTAKSFYFIKNIGYKYKKTSESITKKLFIISELKLKFTFIYMKFIFEFSKNTKYEKDMFNLRLTHMNKNFDIQKYLSKINYNKNFYFYYKVINMIANCLYISDENMNLLNKLKNIIEKKKELKKLDKIKNSIIS